jgi:hypothetical protein
MLPRPPRQPGGYDERQVRPEATGGYQKYDLNSVGSLVNAGNTANATYVDACRVIRVDGLWRTAADMYSRQFGYLETQTNSYQADNGLPTTTATNYYTQFVKDYLSQYDGSVATAPTNAQVMYDTTSRNLNVPTSIDIAQSTDTKSRFMHARGLYVDYLEKQARDTLANALSKRRAKGECLAGSAELPDCVLPYLPFSTINVTEFADYSSSNTNVIYVHTGGFLPWSTSNLPSRGATEAKGTGTANNNATLLRSNSGLAATESLANGGIPGPVDKLGDDVYGSDSQVFNVGGSSPSGSDSFYIRASGLATSSPGYTAVIGGVSKVCITSGTDYICSPAGVTLPASGTLTVSNYWKELDAANSGTTASVLFPASVCTATYDNGVKNPPTYTDTFVHRRGADLQELPHLQRGDRIGLGHADDGRRVERQHDQRNDADHHCVDFEGRPHRPHVRAREHAHRRHAVDLQRPLRQAEPDVVGHRVGLDHAVASLME